MIDKVISYITVVKVKYLKMYNKCKSCVLFWLKNKCRGYIKFPFKTLNGGKTYSI